MNLASDIQNPSEHDTRRFWQGSDPQWTSPQPMWYSEKRRFTSELPYFINRPSANDPRLDPMSSLSGMSGFDFDPRSPFPDYGFSYQQLSQEGSSWPFKGGMFPQPSLDDYSSSHPLLSDHRFAEQTARHREDRGRGLVGILDLSQFQQARLLSTSDKQPLTSDLLSQRNYVLFDAAANVLLATLDLADADRFRAKLPIAALNFAASPNLHGVLSAFDNLNLLGRLSSVTPSSNLITGVVNFPIHHSLHTLPELVYGNVLRRPTWIQNKSHWLHYYEATLDPRTDLAVVRNRQGRWRKALSIGLTLVAGVSVILAPATFPLTLPLLSLGQSVIDFRAVRYPRKLVLPSETSPEEFSELLRRFRQRLYG